MKDPLKVSANIALGIYQAGTSLGYGLGKLVCETQDFTQDAKKVLTALSEKWDSMSPEERFEALIDQPFK